MKNIVAKQKLRFRKHLRKSGQKINNSPLCFVFQTGLLPHAKCHLQKGNETMLISYDLQFLSQCDLLDVMFSIAARQGSL